ncbi:MAG: hypothetical protein JNK15_10630 [Planctomycetes bacterium]|nr:hypothetical protein [Planctomycetota bacterium]
MLLLRCAAIALFTTWLPAQIGLGDVVVTGFSSTQFGVIRPNNAVNGYTTGGFLGTGSSQAVLWDPNQPQSVLLGGFGFLGRATVTGASGTAVGYSLLTTNVGIVSQMSWDDAGFVVFVDSTAAQVRRLEPVTGTVVDVSTGPQPWGTELSAGAWDPATGDVVCGGNGGIWRLPLGSPTGVPIVTGLGGYVSGIQFDPVTGEILATVLTVNRVIRIDGNHVVTDVAPPFSVPGPNALAIDHGGDLIAGGGTGQVYRIPRTGGSPTFLAANTSPANAVNGLTVVGAGGYALPFGAPCLASNGLATLRASGPFLVGSTVTTRSENHMPNAAGLLAFGLSRTSWLSVPLPVSLDPVFGTAGCDLLVSLDLTLAGVASATAPAELTFAFVVPPAFAGQTVFLQHASLEPVAGGLAASNGLVLHLP